MQISNLHQICIKSASHLHQFFHTFCLGKSSKVCTTKPDCHKFSKVQGFNTKAWCTQVFKSTRIQHQSLMYTSFQKYKDSTPKPDVHKFSKVQGFNTKAWCTEVLKSTRFPHQSLMYRSSQKYKVSTAMMAMMYTKAWCIQVGSTLYLRLGCIPVSCQCDVLVRFACLCTCELKCMMYFWDLHVFVLMAYRMDDTHWSLHIHLTLCDL